MASSLLETERLTKRFGDMTAVDKVDIELREDELTSIIGPNGAGKTTFYNLLTGELEPDEGRILFKGEDITSHDPHEVAKKGIIRAYQIRNFFPDLSVFRNLQAALIVKSGEALTLHRSADSFDGLNDEVLSYLERAGLADAAHETSGNLNYGDQKRLEVLMSMAMEPDLAILDEPTAGMSPEETQDMVEFIQGFAESTNLLLTEHDMDVIRSISDRILVLHNGRIIADGTPEEIAADDDVREVYLGAEQ